MLVRRTGAAARLIKPLLALLAVGAGIGLSMAAALGSSTEVGTTTATPTFGVNTPVVPVSTVPGTPSYETPNGVLTSWRFHSSGDAAAGAVRLKIFHYTGNGLAFKVVAESSLKALTPSTAFEFKERIPVSKNDLIGVTASGDAEVGITVPGTPENRLGQFGGGDISVGQTGTATIAWPDLRPSVAATVESDADNDGFGDDTQDKCPVDPKSQALCQISFGKVKRNKDKGTAIIRVTVPGEGTLSLRGKGVVKQRALGARLLRRVAGKAVTGAGTVKLRVKPKGKAKRKLDRKGVTKVRPVVTFKPTGGPAVTKSKRVKLVQQP